MSGKALKISLEAFIKKLHDSACRHTQGLRHYTTMSSLMGMLHSEQIYFSLLRKSNDGGEWNSDRHYMLCFNYEKAENVALWYIYGVPRNESIRLTFPRSEIMEWVDSLRNGELECYGVENKARTVPLKDVCPEVSMCDVAYYEDGVFTHKDKVYMVMRDRRPDSNACCDSRLAPYVKKWAWSYEQEFRIVIEFEKPVLNSRGKPFERIAVDFDEPLQALRDGCGEIRLGPWYKSSAKAIGKIGMPQAHVEPSAFTGQINLRTPCSACDKAKGKCNCKYKNKMN